MSFEYRSPIRALIPERAVEPQRTVVPDRIVRTRELPKDPCLDDLKKYQQAGVIWLRSKRRGLLADEMALGKSVQALRALSGRDRAIVVGPASSEITWRSETKKWRPDLRFTSGEELRKPHEGELFFISYGSLPEAPKGSSKLLHEPMRDVTLIPDECHFVKSYKAQRTSRVRKLGAQCGRVWGLTGTPMPGKPEDLWGLLEALGLSHDVFPGGWYEFVDLCSGKKRFIRAKGGALRQIGYQWGDISPEVKERLDRVMLRRLRSQVYTDMPKVQYLDIRVPVSSEGIALLDETKRKWDELGLDPHDLPPFELMSEARAALARSRIQAAVEWADTCSQSMQILVFSAHTDPIVAMQQLEGAGAFTGATPVKERERMVNDFKAGKLRILAMTIDTGGTSLNLQEAGAILYVDRSYTPGDNTQADARVLRPGQKHASVLIARMMSEHPLDVRVQEILDEKEPRIAAMVGT